MRQHYLLCIWSCFCTMVSSEHNGFFDSVDEDGDGVIRADEVRDFVIGIGGKEFNEASEIEEGVTSILTKMDFNADRVVSPEDMEQYWKKMGKLLTVEETAKWAQYAVQLPDLAKTFKAQAITGYDIPSLLTNPEEMEELGVPKRHQRAFRRSVAIKMMGLGSGRNFEMYIIENININIIFEYLEPDQPDMFVSTSISCSSIVLAWAAPEKATGFPIHMYELEVR